MTKSCIAVLCASVLLAWPCHAQAGPFERIKDTLESRYHVEFERLPMGGLLRVLIKAARPEGVLDMKVAPIARYDRARLGSGRPLDDVLSGTLGKEWTPLVRVRSAREGTWTSMHLRAREGRYTLLIVALDDGDGALVEVTLRPEKLLAWLREPVRSSREAGRS